MKRAGHAPNKNIVALNEMILILQQIIVAGVAASVSSGGPGGARGGARERSYWARFCHMPLPVEKEYEIVESILSEG